MSELGTVTVDFFHGITTQKCSAGENFEQLCRNGCSHSSDDLRFSWASKNVPVGPRQARAASETSHPIALRRLFRVIRSMIEHAHAVVDALAKLLELVGAAIILGGVVLASARFAVDGNRTNWEDAYQRYRAGLGRGILLGLELLVGADIISTITAPLTFASVGLLGAIIAIRTFLSFSLETEIEGCWPWRRKTRDEKRSRVREQSRG